MENTRRLRAKRQLLKELDSLLASGGISFEEFKVEQIIVKSGNPYREGGRFAAATQKEIPKTTKKTKSIGLLVEANDLDDTVWDLGNPRDLDLLFNDPHLDNETKIKLMRLALKGLPGGQFPNLTRKFGSLGFKGPTKVKDPLGYNGIEGRIKDLKFEADFAKQRFNKAESNRKKIKNPEASEKLRKKNITTYNKETEQYRKYVTAKNRINKHVKTLCSGLSSDTASYTNGCK